MRCEWESSKIGDLGKIITGKTPPTKNQDLWDGNIPFITPRDLQNGKTVLCTERTITSNGIKVMQSVKLPPKSVCVSCIGNIGYVAMTYSECISNQQINSIIVNSNNDADFVYYLMKSLHSTFKNYEGQSTTLSILNKKHFSDIDICIPPLDIQKKIAAILSALDEKIAINRAINDNLQQQARSLYKSWFIDFDPFGNTMPADWKNGRLKDVLKLKRQSIKAGSNTVLPYLPIDIIPMRTFALTGFKPNEDAQSSLITFDKDDIIIGAMRVYFHRVVIAPCDGITRTTCFTLSPFQKDYLGFALLCCDQDSSIDYAQSTSKGSTMPYAIWKGGLGDMEIVIPSQKIARKFNELILPMIRQIQNSYFENSRLRELRDGLLPRLMSGEIDVSAVQL